MKRTVRSSQQQNVVRPLTSPPFTGLREPLPASLSQWPGFVLYWVASLGAQVYAAALAPLGLRPFDVGILSLLESDGPLVQARLSDKLHIDKATMVRLLNDLEGHGLIERRPHPRDGRAFAVSLLPAGAQRIREAEQANRTASERFFGVLSADEQRVLHDLLVRLATSHSSLVFSKDERSDSA